MNLTEELADVLVDKLNKAMRKWPQRYWCRCRDGNSPVPRFAIFEVDPDNRYRWDDEQVGDLTFYDGKMVVDGLFTMRTGSPVEVEYSDPDWINKIKAALDS